MAALNWLHITDLHFGSPGQEWLWPNSRHLIKEDLRKLSEVTGPWDLVLFTGDLTYNGDAEQFSAASEDLLQLWELFGSLGCRPVLLAVPGNHDLLRPKKPTAIVKALEHWQSDSQLRDEFYGNPSSEYRTFVDECFHNYSSWWEQQPFPKPTTFNKGLLPGDFVATVEKPGIRVAIGGLNTAFLQLTDDNYSERLFLHEMQLHSACGGDLVSWSEKGNLALLMTHHGPDWLNQNARNHMLAEIYAPGRFLYHFCGHLHVPKTLNISEAGAETRRLRQAPSLCGLQTWGDGQLRMHGYIAGRFEIVDVQGTELLWPRLMVKTYAGHWRMAADQGYQLDRSESVSYTFTGRRMEAVDEGESTITPMERTRLGATITERHEDPIASALVKGTIPLEVAKAGLQAVPRFRLDVEAKHRRVRQEQQAELEMALRRSRFGWIVSDWGLGKNGFLSTVLERVSSGSKSTEIYRINCEDLRTIDQLISAADDQFGVPLQQFVTLNAVLPFSVLVFDELSVELSYPSCSNEDGQTLKDIIGLILDFCPAMNVIIVSRQKPVESGFHFVELQPLNLAEIRSYLSDQTVVVEDDIILEQIEMRSGGLPKDLDLLVKDLKVYSLAEILEAKSEECRGVAPDQEPVSKALKAAVASLAFSTDTYSRRSYRMLKVLSVLPSGAPFDLIRRFYPTEPFYVANAEQLIDFSLVESDPLTPLRSEIAIKGSTGKTPEELAPKLLRVPRQVRDYVHTLMTEQEYSDIMKQSARLLFGAKWREGNVKLQRQLMLEKGERGQGPGNEHTVARHLLREAVQTNDVQTMKMAAGLSIGYCDALVRADHYKEAWLASEEIFNILKRTPLKRETAEIAVTFGKALRMKSSQDRAIEMFEASLELDHGFFSKDKKARIYLSLGFAYSSIGDGPSAIKSFNMVLKLAQKDSSPYIQALAEILVAENSADNLEGKLSTLEQKARRKGYEVVANNIALEMARKQKKSDKAASLYELVLGTTDHYNRVRAIVKKAENTLRTGGTLSNPDRRALGEAYEYLFGQRLRELFNSCHEVVWTMLKREGKVAQMLIIFRFSSFLWRIRGELDQEKKYLKDIGATDMEALGQGGIDLRHELSYVESRQQEQSEEAGKTGKTPAM